VASPLRQILRSLELRPDSVPDRQAYPFSIPALRSLERLDFHPEVTFLVGENGSGKSTLIEAIAIAAGFNPEGGTKSFTGRARPSESSLSEHVRLVRGARRERGGFFLRAETMFNVSTEAEDYQAYGWERLHERSHGEAFLWLLEERFRAGGLFVLDEPEAALSPQRQLGFLAHLDRLVRGGSQLVIATHSPILLAYPRATIYQLEPTGLRRVAYQDTDHYRITRGFLMNPERMLRELLGEAAAPVEDEASAQPAEPAARPRAAPRTKQSPKRRAPRPGPTEG
jgi:predicted ATPase